jgi:hypothetical protein
MPMKFWQETTQWAGNTPNHVYLLNDDRSKAAGYVKHGTDQLILFPTVISFNIKNRKFKEVANRWDYVDRTVQTKQSWQILGSKGDTYTVVRDRDQLRCTCSGFKFRSHCRHVEQVAA